MYGTPPPLTLQPHQNASSHKDLKCPMNGGITLNTFTCIRSAGHHNNHSPGSFSEVSASFGSVVGSSIVASTCMYMYA